MSGQIIHAISPPQIRCREIGAADINKVATLLATGFDRNREHWLRCFQRLTQYPSLPSYPKYGYLLTCNDNPVGVILLIFVSVLLNGQRRTRCHVCSWYVEPAFTGYAAVLASHALRYQEVTYVNVSPALHTLPILDAQGYVQYSRGWFAAVPALCASLRGARVSVFAPESRGNEGLQPLESELLSAHAGYGCLSVVCRTTNGSSPFIFMRRKFETVPFAYLVYCRTIDEFVRFAGPLGRFLAWRGIPFVFLDANGRLPGLIGRYLDNYPKYFRGPDQPRLGDLTYSELVMFRFVGDRISRQQRRTPVHPKVPHQIEIAK
jgi:hypothetical protein